MKSSVSDFEAQEKLFAILGRLKDCILKLPESFQKKQIGTFWESSSTRAPFEEELTLKQLASFDPEILIRKRSFTSDKMIALTTALEKAMNLEIASTLPFNNSTSFLKPKLEVIKHPVINLQIKPNKELTPLASVFFEGFLSKIHTIFRPENHFVSFFERLLSLIPSDEFTLWYLSDKQPTAKNSKLIKELFLQFLPEVWLHWQTALSGSGASSRYLVQSYCIKPSDKNAVLEASYIIKPILLALDALPVVIEKKYLEGHFTFSIETSQQIYKALKGKQIKSKKEFIEKMSLPFPLFDVLLLWDTLN